MSGKTYTREEFLEITGQFIREQGKILEENLRKNKRTINGDLCTK